MALGVSRAREVYGVFAAEARDLDPKYAPKTVNTDGWASTRNAFQTLYAVAYDPPGCHRTSNAVVRPMNRLCRLMDAGRGLHGHQSSSELRLPGWALLMNATGSRLRAELKPMRQRLRFLTLLGNFIGFESIEAFDRLRQTWIPAALVRDLYGTPAQKVEIIVGER
jgi:hypothetical protein